MPTISGLAVFFTVTTVLVLLYPVIRLIPFWFQRQTGGKVRFHRQAIAALTVAIDRSEAGSEQRARLQAQHDWHAAALAILAPTNPTSAPEQRKAA